MLTKPSSHSPPSYEATMSGNKASGSGRKSYGTPPLEARDSPPLEDGWCSSNEHLRQVAAFAALEEELAKLTVGRGLGGRRRSRSTPPEASPLLKPTRTVISVSSPQIITKTRSISSTPSQSPTRTPPTLPVARNQKRKATTPPTEVLSSTLSKPVPSRRIIKKKLSSTVKSNSRNSPPRRAKSCDKKNEKISQIAPQVQPQQPQELQLVAFNATPIGSQQIVEKEEATPVNVLKSRGKGGAAGAATTSPVVVQSSGRMSYVQKPQTASVSGSGRRSYDSTVSQSQKSTFISSDPSAWTVAQVASYLSKVNLDSEYVSVLSSNRINGLCFMALTKQELKSELGIKQFAAIKTIEVAQLRLRDCQRKTPSDLLSNPNAC